MIGLTILHYTILEKLGEARPNDLERNVNERSSRHVN